MSPSADPRYTLTELADLAGVTPRTIRFYVTQGLLPAPGQVGPGAKYDDTDLARLRLIKRLQRDHRPLADIRRQLDQLDDATVLRLAEETHEPPTDSALEYIRSLTRPSSMALMRATVGSTPPIAPVAPVAPLASSSTPVGSLAKSLPDMSPAAPTVPAAPAIATDPGRLERSQWDRIELGPDVELHVRRPLPRTTAKQVDRLISIARDLLEEDPS
jgi:DNA-binding transcriptional MerR regulator